MMEKDDIAEVLGGARYDVHIYDDAIYVHGAEEEPDQEESDDEILAIRALLPKGWTASYTGSYSGSSPDIVVEEDAA